MAILRNLYEHGILLTAEVLKITECEYELNIENLKRLNLVSSYLRVEDAEQLTKKSTMFTPLRASVGYSLVADYKIRLTALGTALIETCL